jgi:hypothetical protein
MRKVLVSFLLIFGLMSSVSADFKTGYDAYQQGDYKTAIKELRPLAEQGNADEQFILGLMYDNGQGVTKDDQTAVKWYRKAAEQGQANAQTSLGVMYALGQIVAKDEVLAYMWFNLALNGELRDFIAKRMLPEQIAEAQRLSREWLAKQNK